MIQEEFRRMWIFCGKERKRKLFSWQLDGWQLKRERERNISIWTHPVCFRVQFWFFYFKNPFSGLLSFRIEPGFKHGLLCHLHPFHFKWNWGQKTKYKGALVILLTILMYYTLAISLYERCWRFLPTFPSFVWPRLPNSMKLDTIVMWQRRGKRYFGKWLVLSDLMPTLVVGSLDEWMLQFTCYKLP